MRANFIVSEVAGGLRRNVTMTVAMILTTAISLSLLGAGLLIYRQVDDMKKYFYFKVELSIYLTNDITAAQRDALRQRLQNDPLVASVIYEDKATAYQRFKQQFKSSPDLINNVSPTSLPESFRVKLKNPTNFQQASDEYTGAPGVDQVIDQKEILGKLFSILSALQNGALIVAAVQGVIALLLIGNAIQVAAFSRRRETGIMKLVGASNWYVQLPFVIEAAIAGLVGALIAILLLALAKWLYLDRALKPLVSVFPPISWQRVVEVSGPLVLIGVVLASVTAWLTLRFYVRV